MVLVISRFQWLISTQELVTHDVYYHRDPPFLSLAAPLNGVMK
jgi:hypothetical protein